MKEKEEKKESKPAPETVNKGGQKVINGEPKPKGKGEEVKNG